VKVLGWRKVPCFQDFLKFLKKISKKMKKTLAKQEKLFYTKQGL